MSKAYQPIVIENTEKFIKVLEESNFFEEYEITDLSFVRNHLSDLLTEKFIKGELDGESPLFDDEEFTIILKELVAGSLLYQLKEKGLIDSYEDENTEEMFFLTKKGKKYIKGKDTDMS